MSHTDFRTEGQPNNFQIRDSKLTMHFEARSLNWEDYLPIAMTRDAQQFGGLLQFIAPEKMTFQDFLISLGWDIVPVQYWFSKYCIDGDTIYNGDTATLKITTEDVIDNTVIPFSFTGEAGKATDALKALNHARELTAQVVRLYHWTSEIAGTEYMAAEDFLAALTDILTEFEAGFTTDMSTYVYDTLQLHTKSSVVSNAYVGILNSVKPTALQVSDTDSEVLTIFGTALSIENIKYILACVPRK